MLKNIIDILKREQNNVIFLTNIFEPHLFRDALHLNSSRTAMVVLNLYQGFNVYDAMWIPIEKSCPKGKKSH